MKRYSDAIINQNGVPVPSATVTVRVAASPAGSGALATLYSDDGVTSLTNPLTADAQGNFYFFVADGRYDIILSGGTPAITSLTLADVEIFDATNKNAGDIPADLSVKILSNIRFVDGVTFTTVQAAINNLSGAKGLVVVPSTYAGAEPTNLVSAVVLRLDKGYRLDANAAQLQALIGNPNARGVVAVKAVPPATDVDRYFAGVFQVFAGTETTDTGAASNDKVALYAAARRDSSRPERIWAGNFVTRVETGANVSDVETVGIGLNNNHADMPIGDPTAVMNGLSIASAGTFKPHRAIHINATADGNKWKRAIDIPASAFDGFGLRLGDPADVLTAPLAIRQIANNTDTITLQRFTDTAPAGFFIRAVNAANSASIFFVNRLGEVEAPLFTAASGEVRARRFRATQATALVAGDFALSAGWGTTASVGSIRGVDQFHEFVVTSAGIGQGASPTITLTYKDGTWTTAPVVLCNRQEFANQPTVTVTVTTQSATTYVLTLDGTPVAAQTFRIACHVGGI